MLFARLQRRKKHVVNCSFMLSPKSVFWQRWNGKNSTRVADHETGSTEIKQRRLYAEANEKVNDNKTSITQGTNRKDDKTRPSSPHESCVLCFNKKWKFSKAVHGRLLELLALGIFNKRIFQCWEKSPCNPRGNMFQSVFAKRQIRDRELTMHCSSQKECAQTLAEVHSIENCNAWSILSLNLRFKKSQKEPSV